METNKHSIITNEFNPYITKWGIITNMGGHSAGIYSLYRPVSLRCQAFLVRHTGRCHHAGQRVRCLLCS